MIEGVREQLQQETMTVQNATRGFTFTVVHDLSSRQAEIIRAGGLLNYTRTNQGG